jgi:hypothetical protein
MHEKSLCHIVACNILSKARFVVRNATIRFEFVEQVQAVEQVVERPVEEQLGLRGGWSLVQVIELQQVAQQR